MLSADQLYKIIEAATYIFHDREIWDVEPSLMSKDSIFLV